MRLITFRDRRGEARIVAIAGERQALGEYRAFIVKESERWREHVKAAAIEPQ
jgi:hypothetical protein